MRFIKSESPRIFAFIGGRLKYFKFVTLDRAKALNPQTLRVFRLVEFFTFPIAALFNLSLVS